MNNDGWIKIYVKLLKWEWYGDPLMVATLIHLLLKANWKDKKWRGVTVKRGQLITSRTRLADEIGLTERQLRTCLERMQESGEITCETTNRYTIITICNYDSYQEKENTQRPAERPAERPTSDQQTTNKRPTSGQQTTTTSEVIEEQINYKSKEEQTGEPARTRMGVEFFGMFHNVELLPSEHRALIEQYGEALVDETIDSLSCKLMDGNAQSSYHYATLQTWLRHSYKAEVPQPSATETEEQKMRHIWDTMTPKEQEEHLKNNGGLYPWQDPKFNKSLKPQDHGESK